MITNFLYVYEATGCTTVSTFNSFIDTEVYLVGSNDVLTPGQTISAKLLSSPIQVQCMTITSSEVPTDATYEYISSYSSCSECLSGNSVVAYVKHCDSNNYLSFAVNPNYKIGDFISVEGATYAISEGDFGYIINGCFKIIDITPYDESLIFIPFPYILNYKIKENCDVCQTMTGRYYIYFDCTAMESGIIYSHQIFNDEDTIYLNTGNSSCKVVYKYYTIAPWIIEDSKDNILSLVTGSTLVTSSKVFTNCGECLTAMIGEPQWQEEYDGNGTINFISSQEIDIVGPNEGGSDGWSYIKVQMPYNGSITFNYIYTTTDDCANTPDYDWGFYYVSQDEPSGSDYIDFESNIFAWCTGSTGGTTTIYFNEGDWVSIGVYSVDSCCGPGVLSLLFNPFNLYSSANFISCDGDGGTILYPTSKNKLLNSVTELPYVEVTNSGLDTMSYNEQDDDYVEIPLPTGFTVNFLGQNYNTVYLSTNGYITFDGGTGECCFDIPADIPSSVGYPGVFLSTAYGESVLPDGMDDYLFNWYSGLTDGGNQLVIRFEGTYLEYNSDIDAPPLIFSFIFYLNEPNYFDLVIQDNTIFFNGNPTGGISDGINGSWVIPFDSSSNKKYRISNDSYVFKANYATKPKICGQLGSTNNTNLGVLYSDVDFGYNQYNQYVTTCGINCDTLYQVQLSINDGSGQRFGKGIMKLSDIQYTQLNGPYFDISMGGQVSSDIFLIINYYL